MFHPWLNITTDASTASSWLGWAGSITSATLYNKTNPTAGAAVTSGKEELNPTIKKDSDKDKQSSSGGDGLVEKASDQEEQEDDDRWEDGGWGEEVELP